MNIKLFNSVPYSNREEFITGLTELGRLLNLSFEVDTFNNKENGYIMYYPGNIHTGISFIISSSKYNAYLYNSNYFSNSLSSFSISACYIYYAISDDGKTVALGFNNNTTTPTINIFMTSAVNLTDPNEKIIIFGTSSIIVSKDFYETVNYNSSMLIKDNLVILSPISTLLQNKCYKLHNIYITNVFKNTFSAQEFLLNNKYYVSSSPTSNGNGEAVWVMQI